jgi:hypothetical protein
MRAGISKNHNTFILQAFLKKNSCPSQRKDYAQQGTLPTILNLFRAGPYIAMKQEAIYFCLQNMFKGKRVMFKFVSNVFPLPQHAVHRVLLTSNARLARYVREYTLGGRFS